MVLCSICKKEKTSKNNWIIQEHAVDNSILRQFKVCDDCASSLIKKIYLEMNPRQKEIDKIDLTKTGLVDSISITKEGHLEVILSMDLAKARRIVLEETKLLK